MNDQFWIKLLPHVLRSRIEGRGSLQQIITNTGWLAADSLVRMVVGLILSILIARYLGPEQFGALSFATAFVALFGAFASLGLDGIVVRNIVRQPAKKYEILATAFILKLCGGVVAFAVAMIGIWLVRPSDSQACWLVAILSVGMIFQAFDVLDLWFQSQVLSRYTVCAKNAAFILLAMVKVILLWQHAPLVAFAWAGSAEIALGAFGLIIAYRLNKQLFASWRIHMTMGRELLAESWPLMLSGLAVTVYVKIDQIMLGSMLSDKTVGIYSAAIRISELWYFIPMAIVSSIAPVVMQLKQQNEADYYNKLQMTFDAIALLAYSIAIPVTLLSDRIIHLLYSTLYKDASLILTIHVWSLLFVFLGVVRGLWILAEGFTRISLYTTISGALLNIVLNIFLIPRYGAVGAAVATVISYGFSDYILFVTLPGLRKIGNLMTRSILLHYLWRDKVNVQ